MSTSTRLPGFLDGVGVAAAASIATGALTALLAPLVGRADATALALAGIGIGYGLYLAWRSPAAGGRLLLPLALAAATLLGLLIAPRWVLPAQLALLWLGRTLLFPCGPLAALADLGLVLLGLGAALWAIAATGSPAAAVWSFLLVQALFPALAAGVRRLGRPGAAAGDAPDTDPRFEPAARSAATSLRRLAASR
jgi:hypothetical protein